MVLFEIQIDDATHIVDTRQGVMDWFRHYGVTVNLPSSQAEWLRVDVPGFADPVHVRRVPTGPTTRAVDAQA